MKKRKSSNINFRTQLALTCLSALSLSTASIAQAKEAFFVPSKPQPKAPLFVVLHGCLSDAQDIEKTTRFSEFAEAQGFYVFYPEPQLEDSKGCFEFYTEQAQKPGGGDAHVIVNKVQQYMKDHDIDPSKVFVTGMSAGSSLVPNLINCYPDVFRGAVLHSGMAYGVASTWQESIWVAQMGPNKYKERNNFCNSSDYKGKVFIVHGTNDKIMNSKNFSVVKNDYLKGLKSKTTKVLPVKNTYGYTRKYYYHQNEVMGQTVIVNGMGHDWSGGKPRLPLSLYGPDVTPMIIDFFLN